MEQLTRKQCKDLAIVARFIEVFCRAHHDRTALAPVQLPAELGTTRLCPDCAGLLAYGIARRRHCPLDPKPSCKKCTVHCYSRDYRQRIREIMAFSGRRMILRGRLDYLWHYLF